MLLIHDFRLTERGRSELTPRFCKSDLAGQHLVCLLPTLMSEIERMKKRLP
jgi:hypothetical protein